MQSPVSFLCTILFAAAAGGATVEILTEGWTGSGNTNAWKFANLGTDGAMGAGSFIEIAAEELRKEANHERAAGSVLSR